MNRRDFGKAALATAAVVAVAPQILATPKSFKELDERSELEEYGYTPEQIAAMIRMSHGKWRIYSIFHQVQKEFPQKVPNGADKIGWRYGDPCRILGCIGSANESSWSPIMRFSPSTDLSDIKYVAFVRQAVRNRHTNELKYFASWTPAQADSVYIGKTVVVKEYIHINTSDEEVARIAREMYLQLENLAVEFYNKEEILG